MKAMKSSMECGEAAVEEGISVEGAAVEEEEEEEEEGYKRAKNEFMGEESKTKREKEKKEE